MTVPERMKRGRTVVLIIGDDEGLLARTRRALVREGIDVETATSGAGAMAAFAGRPFDLVVLDLGRAEVAERELLRGLRSLDDVAVMLLTGRDTDGNGLGAVDERVEDDLEPFGFVAFQARLRGLLRRAGRAHGLDGRIA